LSDKATPMPEVDMFAHTLKKFGEPDHAHKVSAAEGARYVGRVPGALIRFWVEHGRGSYHDGKFWICDPAPFESVIDDIFHDDVELRPADMTAVGYSAFGRLKLWHRQRRSVSVDFLFLQVHNPPASSWHNKDTGVPFSEDFSISCFLTDFQYSPAQVDTQGADLLPPAIGRHGPLQPGEIYGFVPALHLGGAYDLKNLRRMSAPEHFSVIAQTANFNLTRLTAPEPPHHPYGRTVVVRGIGQRS
jgi:hypothetical protein